MPDLGTCTNCGRHNMPMRAKGRCPDCNDSVTDAVRKGKDVDQALRIAADVFRNVLEDGLYDGNCRNCGTPSRTLRKGFCWPCYRAQKGKAPGSPEYDAALAMRKYDEMEKLKQVTTVEVNTAPIPMTVKTPTHRKLRQGKAGTNSKQFCVMIHPKDFPLWDKIQAQAAEDRRTLSAEMVHLMEIGLSQVEARR